MSNIQTKIQHHKTRDPLPGITFPKKGMTKQNHKQECDINHIMAKYQKTGVLNHLNKHQDNYGFCTSDDLHTSLNMINTANEMFDDLPSKARTKFGNDPGTFLDFVQDPNNEGELYDLGLTEYPLETTQKDTPEPTPEPSIPE